MPRSGNSSRERGHHRRRRRGEPPPSSSSYSLDEEMPVEVVCTAHAVASSKNSIELGLVLSCFVFGLYLHGFYASMMVLPAVATGRSLGGGNLNLAKLLPNKMTDPLLLDIKTPEEYHNLQQQQIGDSKEDEFPMMVPYATWPVMKLQDIPSQFETILHPGDTTTQMSVPKFWSPPLQNPNVVFTRDQAMKVGTCIEVDPITGSHVRGDACPPHQRTIFLAIASYRDYQCRYTVESVFNRAEYPERIRVGEFFFVLGRILITSRRTTYDDSLIRKRERGREFQAENLPFFFLMFACSFVFAILHF